MSTPAHCCEWCGAALLNKPHPVHLNVDGVIVLGKVLCVRCKDLLVDKVEQVVGFLAPAPA